MKRQVSNERIRMIRNIERLLEGPMVFLGFAWMILLIIELIWGLGIVLQNVSLVIWAVFIVDFSLKFFLAPSKARYLKSNWLTALSLIIPAFRLFRILRVFRLLRGVRVVKILATLNRSMRSLGATMSRRGFAYVIVLTMLVTFGGAAGMYAIERNHLGFENYGMSLWWTSMRIITAGSDFWPATSEGRVLAFVLSLFGYAIFGYVTATLATFFIGRDAEDNNAPVAGANDVAELKAMIRQLSDKLDKL